MKQDVIKAIEVLNQGGIVIFPTDTAFGIGCRIDNNDAIKRLFKIRKRPIMKTPVLFDSRERVDSYLLPYKEKVSNLMDNYWPGALTIELTCNIKLVPSLVRAGGVTLGVRIPDHKVPTEIIKKINLPILGPSANFHGEKTPFKFSDLDKRLIKLVDYVIEGKTKGSGQASTVVDCSISPWKIIRQGVVVVPDL